MSDTVKQEATKNEYTHFVGVKFSNTPRAYFFGIKDLNLKLNDKVIVETVRGTELGTVAIEPLSIDKYSNSLLLKPVLRKATDTDIKLAEINQKDAAFALEICEAEVKKLNLDMNLISCEYTLDKSKVLFSYLADDRVDFRELLKVLASKLHTRIELRQIGSRDKAKMVSGVGVCGRELCCARFIGDFDRISINMAKNQLLALNIQKLSGQCGNLMCCLRYEDEAYKDLRKDLPKLNSQVE